MATKERFLRRKVEGEEFWLDLEAGRFYGLNETASALLEAWAAGVREPRALAERLSERFEVSAEEALPTVEAFLAQARARGLIDA
jgi:hypothetical protein